MFKLLSASFLATLLFTLPASATTYTANFFDNDGFVDAEGSYTYTYGEGKLSILSYNPRNAVVQSSVGLGVENNYLDKPNEGFQLHFTQDVFNLKLTFSNWDAGIDQLIFTEGGIANFCVGSCSSSIPSTTTNLVHVFRGVTDTYFVNVAGDADATSTSLLSASWETTDLVATPLPAALPLYAAGMGLLGFLGWRKRRKSL